MTEPYRQIFSFTFKKPDHEPVAVARQAVLAFNRWARDEGFPIRCFSEGNRHIVVAHVDQGKVVGRVEFHGQDWIAHAGGIVIEYEHGKFHEAMAFIVVEADVPVIIP